MKNKAIIGAIVLVVVFLAGFLPQYVKANRLNNELRQARQGYTSAEIWDLAGLAYVQANQKNDLAIVRPKIFSRRKSRCCRVHATAEK